jgi:hypothetical protein
MVFRVIGRLSDLIGFGGKCFIGGIVTHWLFSQAWFIQGLRAFLQWITGLL